SVRPSSATSTNRTMDGGGTASPSTSPGSNCAARWTSCCRFSREVGMAWNAKRMAELVDAVESFNRPRVEEICAGLVAQLRQGHDAIDLDEAKRVLQMLQRKRYFQVLQRLADAMVHDGLAAPA